MNSIINFFNCTRTRTIDRPNATAKRENGRVAEQHEDKEEERKGKGQDMSQGQGGRNDRILTTLQNAKWFRDEESSPQNIRQW